MKKILIGIVSLAICMLSCNNTYAASKIDRILTDVLAKRNINVLTKYVAPKMLIKTDGTYYEGFVSYIGGQERTGKSTPYQCFQFILTKPTKLKLHFISHIEKYVEIELRDADENLIAPFSKRINIKQSPFTETVILNKGNYTFTISKLRASNNISNTGDYRFKFESLELE